MKISRRRRVRRMIVPPRAFRAVRWTGGSSGMGFSSVGDGLFEPGVGCFLASDDDHIDGDIFVRAGMVLRRAADAVRRIAGAAQAIARGIEHEQCDHGRGPRWWRRSEEHTSELPSLMRNTSAVFCLNKKNKKH